MSLVWSVGIYVEDRGYSFDKPLRNLVKTFNARKIRRKRSHIHTYADPFLYVHEETLYLFVEVQEIGGKGYINCWQTRDISVWEDKGVVLKEHFHLSYPFIFQSLLGDVFMIPESGENGDIGLYKFISFPNKLRKVRTLIKGNFVDTNVIYENGIYYLLTTNLDTKQLELFYSTDLESSTWYSHLANPISRDPIVCRNGGGFVRMGNRLFRIAQDGLNFYGSGIVILEVLELNKTTYQEQIIIDDYRPAINFTWQQMGRHHLSVANFNGKRIIAIDGLQRDTFWNKLINSAFKFIP